MFNGLNNTICLFSMIATIHILSYKVGYYFIRDYGQHELRVRFFLCFPSIRKSSQ